MADPIDNTDDSGWNLFGFRLKKKEKQEPISFVPKTDEDGGIAIQQVGAAYNSYSIDIDPTSVKNEVDLINKYREISLVADIDLAIDEIVNEAIVFSDEDAVVSLDFSEEFSKLFSDKTKDLVIAEFNNVLSMLNFNSLGHDHFRNWYIDGRIALHKVVDQENPKNGVVELRVIDVAKLKRIIEVKKDRDPVTGIETITGQEEYYIYSPMGFNGNEKQGIKIAKDSIVWVSSGLIDRVTGNALSYLHKAIRPLNQLRMMEDSDVIYRMVRAPERRVFYIDTSGMARTKAEQYLKDVQARYKNRQVYDAASGQLKDDKKHLTMLEDFWLPRTTGGRGTEITTLPGGQGLGSIENIVYFQNKLFSALNLPLSRLQQGQGTFNLGRQSEINRDEIKFAKFIDKLRRKFSNVFLDVLRTQLILKGITTIDDWSTLRQNFIVKYSTDNFFAELKESDMFKERIANAQLADQFVGKYFSPRYVARKLLKLTDEEIRDMQEEIAQMAPEEPDQGEQPDQQNTQGSEQ